MTKYLILGVVCTTMLLACGEESSNSSETTEQPAQQISKGKQLFNQYCMQCHRLDQESIGPKLKGVFTYWDNDTARISAFIRNAKATIDAGDPRAVKIANDYNHALMTPMPHLTDEDINNLLEYIAE